ncbi:hypothetical protein ABPG73_008169, partial [Tetrahymena malaccensis]
MHSAQQQLNNSLELQLQNSKQDLFDPLEKTLELKFNQYLLSFPLLSSLINNFVFLQDFQEDQQNVEQNQFKEKTDFQDKSKTSKELKSTKIAQSFRMFKKLHQNNNSELKDIENNFFEERLELLNSKDLQSKYIKKFIKKCTLQNFLDRTLIDGENEDQKLSICYQIMASINYLHHFNVIHNDIKPENYLIMFNDQDIIVKLSDFGLAVKLSADNQQFITKNNIGSMIYQAPEIFNSIDTRVYTKKTDIFSVGCVLTLVDNYKNFFQPQLYGQNKNTFIYPMAFVNMIQKQFYQPFDPSVFLDKQEKLNRKSQIYQYIQASVVFDVENRKDFNSVINQNLKFFYTNQVDLQKIINKSQQSSEPDLREFKIINEKGEEKMIQIDINCKELELDLGENKIKDQDMVRKYFKSSKNINLKQKMIQEDQQNILSSGNTNQEAIQNIEAQNLLTQANKIIEVNQDEQIKLNKNKQEENECVYKIEQLVQKIAQLPLVNNQKKFQDLKKALLQLFCNLQIQPKLIGEQIQIFLIEIGKLIDQQPKNCQDQNQKFSLQQLSDIEAYIQNIHTHSQNMPLNQLQQLQTYFENRQKEQDTIPKDLQKVFSQNQKALEIHKKILQLLQVNPDILTNLIEDLLQYLHKIVLQYQNEPEQYQYMLMEFEKILKIFQKEFEQTNQMLEQLFKIQNQVVDLLGQSNLNEGYGNSVLQQYLNQSYQQNILKLLQIYRSLSYKQTHYLYDSSKLKVINLQKEESKQHERSLNSIESSQEFQEKDKQNNKEIQSLDISNPIIGEEFQKQINSPSSSQDNEQDGKKNQKIALKQLNNIQQIKKIIKDYAFQDQDLQFQNEEEILKDGEGLQQFTPQRQWSKDTFIKNNNFDNQKSYIIDKLLENKLYLCQSLAQNEREDLFIGYKNFNSGIYQDLLIKIKFNPSVQELTKDILVMQTLDFSFDHIQIEQNNTHVLFLSLEECIQIDKKLELFVLAIESILNFSKIEKNLEIDFEDIQKQQKQQNQFQISTEFLKVFFKDQKYYICEFYNKENHGIMLQANKNLIIQSFQDYIFNSIFIMDESFSYQQNAAFSLNEEKINQKEDKTSQMQDTSTENDHFTQNKSKNQDQSKSLEGENKQENLKDKDLYQQINQYKYNEFQVQINQQSPQDFNEIQIKKTKREWSENNRGEEKMIQIDINCQELSLQFS